MTPALPTPVRLAAPLGARAEALAAVHIAAFSGHSRGWSATEIADLAATPGTAIWADAGASLAFAMTRTAAGETELLTLATAPAARRQGHARRLLAAILDHGRSDGATRLILDVAAANTPARALYAALGFARIAVRPGYYRAEDGTRDDALVLARIMTEPGKGPRHGLPLCGTTEYAPAPGTGAPDPARDSQDGSSTRRGAQHRRPNP